jgi:hypothetical protein
MLAAGAAILGGILGYKSKQGYTGGSAVESVKLYSAVYSKDVQTTR